MLDNVTNTVARGDSTTLGQIKAEDQYLTFRMHDEIFGIAILRVREIIEYGKVTRVPMTPAYIKGVINLRGQVVPVIDLAYRFGLGSLNICDTSCIVIVEVQDGNEKIILGVVVDEVKEVRGMALKNIEAAPDFGARINPVYLSGVGKTKERFILLLDPASSLNIEELSDFAAMAEK